MRLFSLLGFAISFVLTMQVVTSGPAEAASIDKELKKLCSGYFDVVSGQCLTCPKGYDIDMWYSADSKNLCKQRVKTKKKKAKYAYNTGSVFKACKKGTFANLGSTKCYKCAKGWKHDAGKTVGSNGVCYKAAYWKRKPAASKKDLVGMLAKKVGAEFAKCDKRMKSIIPVVPMGTVSESLFDGKLRITADGNFAKEYVRGLTCEFPKALVNAASAIKDFKSMKTYGAEDMVKNYMGACKSWGVGGREFCSLAWPLLKGVSGCVKAFKPDAYVNVFKAAFKEAKIDSLTINMNKMAADMGRSSAQGMMMGAGTALKAAKGSAEDKLKALLEKTGMSKQVVNRIFTAKSVLSAFKDVTKLQNGCKI